jgi:DNA polymerase-1
MKKILLVDGLSILNRAFYALPLLTTKSGEYTNAVYGFLSILLRFTDELQPDYVTVAFDLPEPTFRHKLYGAYKGTRKGMPDELRAQLPTIKNLLAAMRIPMAQLPGYEADDVLGTLAKKAAADGMQPIIITGDRDLLQLACDTIEIRLPKTRAGQTTVETYRAADVFAKYGVSPTAFIDVKALMGDTSDNVPGVPGIGEVTATKIIAQYGSLEGALENLDSLKPPRAAANLREHRDMAFLSRTLVTIDTTVPGDLTLEKLDMFNEEAAAEVARLELRTLQKRFGAVAATPENATAEAEIIPEIIICPAAAKEYFARLVLVDGAAVHFVWDESGGIVGLAVACDSLPLTYLHTTAQSAEITLFEQADGLTPARLMALAMPFLVGDTPKFLADAKAALAHTNINCATFDAHLAAYVLDVTHPQNCFSAPLPDIEALLGNKGKRAADRTTIRDIPAEKLAHYAAGTASIIYASRTGMLERLRENGQDKLFTEIEMPLVRVLSSMEKAGIRVDKAVLAGIGGKLHEAIARLTSDIYFAAGMEFNINSPQQLGDVLFDKLQLPGGKKTSRGYSTAAAELERLMHRHEVIPLIMEYRAHVKLAGTYIDGMLPLVSRETGRIHGTFHQARTDTGRLSSAEPNLQNIPVRTAMGRELRRAFIPAEGCVFVDADYSQIELRILAHMSEDGTLIRAFQSNEDIHRRTASQVLGIDPQDVSQEERSRAKAVNFGIVYGISAFGLSQDIKLSVKRAEQYIEAYFAMYPGVRAYLDETIARAKRDGYVATIFGRRRALPELASHIHATRQFGQRVAMNMPIQGSAADIIKLAMIGVYDRLGREGLQTRLILQVHDELLLEAPTNEAETVAQLLREEMENAASLRVPLVADVNIGGSWYDTK